MKKEDKNKASLAVGAVGAGYALGSENLHPINYMNKVYQKSRLPFKDVEEAKRYRKESKNSCI